MARGGRRVAMAAAALGLAVLGTAVYAGRGRIREEWHLRKLERGTEEEREAALKALVEMRSSRAARVLFRRITEASRQGEPLPREPARFRDGLVSLDSKAVPALAAAVQDGTDRRLAVEILIDIGPGAREALPLLAELLTEVEFDIRVLAAQALAAIGPAAIPVLEEKLRHPDDWVRKAAEAALAQINR